MLSVAERARATTRTHNENSYFVQLVNSLERRSQDYKVHMEELETNVRSASLMHVKASPQGILCILRIEREQSLIHYKITAIQETLHKQHSSFLALANQVANTHEQVEKAVSEFTKYAKRFQMDEALKYVSVLNPESGKGNILGFY
jgi:hypothetical protein